MSTNYHAEWRIADDVVIHLNIGNTSGPNKQFSTVSGKVFPDLATWMAFLRHNRDTLTILDEYLQEFSVEDIIARFETHDGGSDRQVRWLGDHGYVVHPDHTHFKRWSHEHTYWMDGDQLFCAADFR